MDSFDIIIIGGGIAGVSAALTAKNRGKSVAVVMNGVETTALWKAERITNYPGAADISGRELADVLTRQLEGCGAQLIRGRALNVMPMGELFGVAVGNDFYMSRAVILASGVLREKLIPGESEYLGRGVSYCATCDGMLYRGRRVVLIGSSEEALEDAAFLRGIGCELVCRDKPEGCEIVGDERVRAVLINGERIDADGVFIIREKVSVAQLVPGIECSPAGIITQKGMKTSVPGVFAAGDCTGKPFQLAKAAGEGNTAALSACEYINK